MKRLFNFRLPVFVVCCLAAGIFTGLMFAFYRLDLKWLILLAPLAATAAILVTPVKRSLKPAIIILACALVALSGCFYCLGKINSYDADEISAGTHFIEGRVFEKSKSDYGEYIIITAVYSDGKRVSGKMYVSLSGDYGDYCDGGYKVNFYAKINSYNAFEYGKLNYYAPQNVKYRCSVFGGLKSEYGFSFFGAARSKLRQNLFNHLDESSAAVCFAMLTGNSDYIEDSALQTMRFGGIAHIFAVSGLHIGIVFGIVTFICKRLHINKYVSSAFSLLFVFMYSGVCGFTLSSIRAAIMCVVSTAAKLLYLKNDSFNSLALAVGIILLINPLNLFTVGFQLSVCAVGGIIIFSKGIERGLNKIKIPKRISSSFGVALSAQMGTLPVMLANFGYLSAAGLLMNILVLPVLSALFAVLFVAALICLLIPAAAPVIIYAALPIELVTSFILSIGFEDTLISGFGAGLFVPMYFIAVLFISDKINLKSLKRIVAVFCSAAVLFTFVYLSAHPLSAGYKIAVGGGNSGGVVIIKCPQGTIVIIDESVTESVAKEILNKNYALSPDYVIILGGEYGVTAYENFGINSKNIIVYYEYIPIQPYEGATVRYESRFYVLGINFRFVDGYDIIFDCDGVSVGVSMGYEVPFEYCNLLISDAANSTCESDCTVYLSLNDGYNVFEFGQFDFTAKDGKLKRLGPLPEVADEA